ncbi:hypothetical protein ACJMK2_001086 [Sinanodonta woodiana]|uniref:SEFIR domain-containing protein n=1 Tax=Sinanodonta woodiana TaxID=1069815 RepID=A0ABD3XTF5_SINWO
MAAGRPRNLACIHLEIPPCPIRSAPYPVLIQLARRIDTVNNNDGHGCMILAELLGCTPDNIRSIMTRADRDVRNSHSPTMVLFNDLQSLHSSTITLRDIEKALLELNLEAVNVLYSTENIQKIQRAYNDSIALNNSIEINEEHSICNCFNCCHDNSNITQCFNIPNGVSLPDASQRGLSEVLRAGNPRRTPAIAPETIQDNYVRSDIGCERSHHTGYYCATNESGYLEHQPHSERIHIARGTLSPLLISPDRVAERGPCTAPPCMQSHEERNVHVLRHLARQMSEQHQHERLRAERFVPRDLNSVVTKCISPKDNCHADNAVNCTCGIKSSEFLHSGIPGNNQGQQLAPQHLQCTCSSPDETLVKSSYVQGTVDYSECTCRSQTDLQNNNVLLDSVQTSTKHSNHLISSASEYVYIREPRLNRSRSQLVVEEEPRESSDIDKKRNSMDETKTKALCNGSKNGIGLCSSIPRQTGPGLSVFVTYSRHSLEHVQEVIELCIKLKGKGIRVRVDYSGDKALDLFQNKNDWLDANLKIARYVIVCISPTYYKDAAPPHNTEPIPDIRRLDVRYIYDHLRAEYHQNCSQNMRVIPVIFEKSGANRRHLPFFMSTTYVYTYPQQVDSIIEFIQNFSLPVR